MTNDLVKVDSNAVDVLQDLQNTEALVGKLMQSKHYSKMGPEGVYALVQKAKSIGMNPLEALNGGLYYVQGKVGMSTETMASLVRQAGHSVWKDSKSTDACCILHGKRKDSGDTWHVSFSIEDAKRAGIFKEQSPWGKYPSVMCYNRAMSILCRQLFPDIIKGAGYTHDELKEIAASTSYQVEVESEVLLINKDMLAVLEQLIAEDDNPSEVQDGILSTYKISSLGELLAEKVSSIIKRIKARQDKQREVKVPVIEVVKPDVMEDEVAALFE